MKKGYWFILGFALFVSVLYVLKSDLFLKVLPEVSFKKLLIRLFILFITIYISGLILVRWYYKIKGNG
jgi:hypothetical protein